MYNKPGLKATSIKRVIRKKLDTWINSIPDESLRDRIKEDVIVTGGCITSMLLGEKINDYDIFFKTKATAKAVAEYYVKLFNNNNQIRVGNATVYQPEVIETQIKNIAGELEDRIVLYMKSAGVAGTNTEKYEYFESRPQHEQSAFMESIGEARGASLDNEPGSEEDLEEQDDQEEPIEASFVLEGSDGKKYSALGLDVTTHGMFDQSSGNQVKPQKSDTQAFAEEVIRELKYGARNHIYYPVFMTNNAITLTSKIQIVIRFFGPVSEIHRTFDFVHATCTYDYAKDHLDLPQKALEAILSRNLKYIGSLYPLATLFRIRKFLAKSWRISAGEMLKVAWQISNIDFNNNALMTEQLIGVDAAYMYQLMSRLKEASSEQRIDETYIASLIDEIFG